MERFENCKIETRRWLQYTFHMLTLLSIDNQAGILKFVIICSSKCVTISLDDERENDISYKVFDIFVGNMVLNTVDKIKLKIVMNKDKSNKIKENSNTVRHLIMGQIITTQNLVAIKEVRHAGQ